MSNYMDSARVAYRALPFLSPALLTNDADNYRPVLDENLVTNRGMVFLALTLPTFAFISDLSNLVLPYIISTNSSIVFTAAAAFTTPFVIAVGIVALGILGFKLDQMLTHRTATKAAIDEFTNNLSLSVSNSAFNWLLGDISRIKSLLKSENVNLDKKNHDNRTLLGGAVSKDIEIFSLLWDRASDKNKAEVLIDCKLYRLSPVFQVSSVHQKTMDFLFDNHKIRPKEFTEKEHNEVLACSCGWNSDSLIWFKKMFDLGFSLDAKDETGESIREKISKSILDFAFDHEENQRMPYVIIQDIVEKIKFLQSIAEPKIATVLKEEHKNENSFLSKLPYELFKEISKDVKNSFAERLEYHPSQLEAIAPFLKISYDSIRKAATKDNVKIGNMIWDKISMNERVNLFIDCFFLS